MKIRWTLSLAAAVVVFGSIPALATQNSTTLQATNRKLDAAATTPYVTKHQAANLKRSVGAANARVEDEPVADPGAAPAGAPLPEAEAGSTVPTEGQAQSAPKAAEAPRPEPEKPKYRFMGTACSQNDGVDIALFDNGSGSPVVRRVGDRLEDGAEIVGIERGCVSLEQMRPATKKGESPRKNRFDLYNW